MEPVFEIRGGEKKKFSLEEAQRVSRLLYRITEKKSQRVEALAAQWEALGGESAHLEHLEAVIEAEIKEWEGKVERLGGVPRGLWAADLDSGTGYYCWKFPEKEVDHWHGYSEGNSSRVSLSGQKVAQPAAQAPAPTAEALTQAPLAESAAATNILLNLQEMK